MGHMANIRAAGAIAAAAMWTVIGLAGGIGLAQGPATPQPATAPAPAPATATTSPAVMLEKGIYTEETVGDLDTAIKIYQQIVNDAKANRQYAARAQYRLGMCHLKKGDKAKATAELRELLASYPQDKEIAAQAQKELAKLEPLEEKIAKLRRMGTTPEDVIKVLGEPEKFVWGRQTFTKDNLPETYILQYPKGLHVVVSNGLATEFRSEQPGPGFTYRGKLRLGSPLKDVLDVLGEPSHTVVGEPIGFVSDCLYNDFDGKKGYSYYSRADQGVRVFLVNGNVSALYLTADGDRQEFLPAAKARDSVSQAEIARIVGDVVTSISTMAEGDSRIPPLLASLRELKEPAVVKELTKHFDSDKNTVRRAAIYVLWKGEFADASSAAPGLVKLCSHEEDLTRGMAAIALGAMKVDSAFDTIAEMTAGDKSSYARRCGAYALGLLGEQEAKPILEKALKDPDQLVRNNAEAALTMLAKAGAAASATPHVVATTPAAFADNVDPSLDKITVTFDRPMMDKSWSWTGGGETFPERAGEISYDANRTTCTMPVKLQPGKVYWVGVNSPSHKNFKSADGTPAKRYVILFATKSADGKPTPLPDDLVKRAIGINPADQDNVAGARSVAEEFLAALKAGDTSKALRLVTAASATGHQLSDFAKIPGLSKVVITGDFEDANSALVITSDVLGDHDRKGPLLIRLVKQRGLWVVEDIDLESPEGALKKLEGFLTGADALAAPYAIAKAFVSALAKGDANSALKLVGKEFNERKKRELPQLAKGMDLSNSGPMMMACYRGSARMVFGPASVKTNAARFFLCLTLIQNAPGTEAWSVIDADFMEKQKSAESFIMSAPSSQASTADKEARKAKLINWVEKFFSENYRDITARKTLQWGEPESTPGGNLSIRYKYLATIWNKDQVVINQRFTFTPEGKYVSAETIEKGPASQPAVAGERDQQSPLAEARQVGLAFLQLLQAGQAQPALALTTPDYRKAHPKGFDELAKRIDFSNAKVADVLASPDSACVTLSGVVPQGRKESISLGLGLHREGGKLLIRDVDALPNENAKQEFIAGFQRSLFAAEPVCREYIDPVYLRHAEEVSVEGWRLWNARKLPEAEEKFKTAVLMDPTNANAWNGLGWAQQNQGKPLNAKEAFEKAVALNPKLAGALNGLGWIAKGQGRTEDAIEYWKKAVAASPATTAALSGLATTYAELGQYDKAIEACQQWLKVEPENKDAKAGLEKLRKLAAPK